MRKSNYLKSKHPPISARKKEIRDPKPSAILIVTEGTKTEPLYFQGIVDYISLKYGKNIDIRSTKFDIKGKGLGTLSLVNEAIAMVNHANRQYKQCWIVFDKDDYLDFDEAISLAKSYDFNVAWSNSCFEYWLFLHFKLDQTARSPEEWKKRVDLEFKGNGLATDNYDKNNPYIAKLAITDDYLKKAVKNASYIEKQQEQISPSKQNPCTTVHHLILYLKPYIKELL